MPKVLSPGTTAADRRKAAAVDDAEKKTKYRVKAGQTVTVGEDRDGDTVMVSYGAGEEVELSDAQAKSMPWAVETGERRTRAGQPSRMKQQIEQLKAENERLKKEAKANAKKDDPGREQARQSLLARGDNHIGRGEPQVGSVPAEVADAHDRALLNAELGLDNDDRETDDELAGGMHGMARETAGGGKTTGTGTGTGPTGQASGELKPGESQRPGETDPSKS